MMREPTSAGGPPPRAKPTFSPHERSIGDYVRTEIDELRAEVEKLRAESESRTELWKNAEGRVLKLRAERDQAWEDYHREKSDRKHWALKYEDAEADAERLADVLHGFTANHVLGCDCPGCEALRQHEELKNESSEG